MTKKDVPTDNPGLAKLPTEVRNRMGYKKKGGKVNANSMGRGVNLANGGRIVYKEGGDQIGSTSSGSTRGTKSGGARAYEEAQKAKKAFIEQLQKEAAKISEEKGGEVD